MYVCYFFWLCEDISTNVLSMSVTIAKYLFFSRRTVSEKQQQNKMIKNANKIKQKLKISFDCEDTVQTCMLGCITVHHN